MTPKEKHIKQDEEFLQICKTLTDALFNYLTISTRQCIASHTDPEELIKGTEYRNYLEEQKEILERQIETCDNDVMKMALEMSLKQLNRDLQRTEEDLAMVQADLEKGI